MEIYDVDYWLPDVADATALALGGASRVGGMSLLCPPKPLVDDTAKFLIRDREGNSAAVLLGSPPAFPDAIDRYVQRSRVVAAAVGSELRGAILEPLAEGRADGRSFVILPYNSPLSSRRLIGRLQRVALTRPILSWLRRATIATRSEAIPAGSDPELVGWLEHLAGLPTMPDDARAFAERGLQRMNSGEWLPRRVMSHGDFWVGNILIKPAPPAGWAWEERLTIIDWGGARLDGAGIFDLLQLLGSLGASFRRIRREVLAHCELLDCEPSDAFSHLALAMGALGMSLDNFPMERFADLAMAHFGTLRTALPEYSPR